MLYFSCVETFLLLMHLNVFIVLLHGDGVHSPVQLSKLRSAINHSAFIMSSEICLIRAKFI